MSNTFATIDHVAELASRLVADDAPLASLFTRDYAAEFSGGVGDSIKVRVPGAVKHATRAVNSLDDYVPASLTEQTIPVSLDAEAYAHVVLSRAEADLEIVDLTRQVLSPMSESVGSYIEDAIAAELAATPADATIAYAADAPAAAIIKARAKLRGNGIPAREELAVLAGAEVYAELAIAEALDAEGKVGGMKVHESTAIDPRALYVFSSRALAVVLRAPSPSASANAASRNAPNGAPVTTTQAYNAANGAEVLTASTYVGVGAFPLVVPDHSTGETALVAHGAIVSIDTAPAA